MKTATTARFVAAVFAAAAVSAYTAHAQRVPPPTQKRSALLKLAQPWPTAEELQQLKAVSEGLPLFAAAEPLPVTLAADVKSLNKDRESTSTKRFPGEIRITREGRTETVPVSLRARGHLRRMARTCDFVPIRVDFEKEKVAGTIFDHQRALKLVVQCVNASDYEQYILREYAAYRILNLITPQSLRARLAKVTYVDSANGKELGTRYGFFLEDEDDVARRMGGRTVELQRAMFKDVHATTLDTMMLFQYMIGNTDFSIYALHNVILVQTPDRTLYPVPYDFDITGLVHPPYAAPARGLRIKTVQERFYRGACRAVEQVAPTIQGFLSHRDEIMAIPAAIPDLDRDSRNEMRTYLDTFFSAIRNQHEVKRMFVDQCASAPTM